MEKLKYYVKSQSEVTGLTALLRKRGLKVDLVQINDHLWVVKAGKVREALFTA